MSRRAIGLTDQMILSAALRQDLGTFIAKVFHTVSPGDRYWLVTGIGMVVS